MRPRRNLWVFHFFIVLLAAVLVSILYSARGDLTSSLLVAFFSIIAPWLIIFILNERSIR